jgi:hypothetical protein
MTPVSAQDDSLPVNHVRNPGFERSYDEPNFGPRPYHWSIQPWWPPGGTDISQVSEQHHNGSFSAMISNPLGTAPDSEVLWYQRTDVEVGGVPMAMGGWVRTELAHGGLAHLRVRFGGMSTDPSRTWQLTIDSNESTWVQFSMPPMTAPTGDRVYFQCVLSGPGTVWFDDVWLGEPSDMGNPPVIVSVPPLEATVGKEYTYHARAVDLEGDDVTYELYRGPEGMAVSTDGHVTWTPSQVPEGAVKVVVKGVDTGGHASYQDFFLGVADEEVARPVYAYLLSTHDDHINDGLSSERYQVLLPVMETLGEEHPELRPSLTVLLNGAVINEQGDETEGVLADLSAAVDAGWVDIGYSAFHEPTYDTNPVYSPDYGTREWYLRVSDLNRMLAHARDPLTGVDQSGEGGLLAVVSELGDVEVVTGVGTDAAQLHVLDAHETEAVVLGIADGPKGITTMVGNPYQGTVVAMLSEDPVAPYGIYWQGDRLQMALDDVGLDPYPAKNGSSGLDHFTSGLDRRRVNVVPVLVADTYTYCDPSGVSGGDLVLSPTEWAYDHTDSPQLPVEGIVPEGERLAYYDATCATLEWLAQGLLPGSGGRFVSSSGLRDMVDPGTGVAVSAAELAAASDDLIVRRNELQYPDWVGISWGYCRGDYQYFSLADMYGLLVQALAGFQEEERLPPSVDLVKVHGPREEAPPSQPWNKLLLRSVVTEAAGQLDDMTSESWRVEPFNVIPSRISPGGVEMNAMEFLLLMAEVYLVLFEDETTSNPLINLFPTLQWPVTRAALDLEGRLTDMGDSWTLKPAAANLQLDEEPPSVRYVTPAHGSVNIPLDENVTVTFSERMDETLDLEDAVVLDPPVEAELRWVYHRLVLDPVGGLTDNTTYTATVGLSLRDAAGNPLAAGVTWSFSTRGLANGVPQLYPLPGDPLVEVEENQTARFSTYVEDDGPLPLVYQWWLDGVRVGGETQDHFVFRPSHTDEGEHTVTVVVSDGASPPGQATFTWNVTVVNVNIPPVLLGRVPDVQTVEMVEEAEGSAVFRVSAEDPDEGVLAFIWTVDDQDVNASWVTGDGAVLSFPFDYTSAGEYSVVCRVEDRVGEGFWVRWTLNITDVNLPPVIHGIEPSIPPTLEFGKTVEVQVNVTDPDGDPLSYQWWVNDEPVAETEEPVWTFRSVRDGSFAVTVWVSDGRGGSVPATTSVNVLPEVEPRIPVEPSFLPWVLVAVAAIALLVALSWPYIRRRLGWDAGP